MDDLLDTDACTLPTADRPVRLAEFDELFAQHVRTVERHGDALRLRMSGGPGLRERVVDLTERESGCCSFFTFLIDGTDDRLVLDIQVPSERRGMLDSVADRAEELSV